MVLALPSNRIQLKLDDELFKDFTVVCQRAAGAFPSPLDRCSTIVCQSPAEYLSIRSPVFPVLEGIFEHLFAPITLFEGDQCTSATGVTERDVDPPRLKQQIGVGINSLLKVV